MTTNFKFNDTEKGIDIEDIHSDINKINTVIAPMLQRELENEGIDAKSAAIFFVAFARELLKEINEKDFSELCYKLFTQ
jgi:hypothetical protein